MALKKYSGSILMQVLAKENNLAQYCIQSYDITKNKWYKDTDDLYYYDFPKTTYPNMYVIAIYDKQTQTETGIGHTEIYTDDNIRIQSFDNREVTVYFLCRTTEELSNEGYFYPDTKSTQVYFPDGQTLQDKVTTGSLLEDMAKYVSIEVLENRPDSYRLHLRCGSQDIVTPNLLKNNDNVFYKVFQKEEWKAGDKGVILQIPNEIHHLDHPYVERVFDTENTKHVVPIPVSSYRDSDGTIILSYIEPVKCAVYLKDIRTQ